MAKIEKDLGSFKFDSDNNVYFQIDKSQEDIDDYISNGSTNVTSYSTFLAMKLLVMTNKRVHH